MRVSGPLFWLFVLTVAASAACGDDTSEATDAEVARGDAASPDASLLADAAAPDARSTPDAGRADAAADDASAMDAEAVDTGALDAAAPDAAAPDAQPRDAATPVDSGVTTGSLEVVVAGVLPSTAPAFITIDGPGYDQRIFEAQTIPNLQPGSYTVEALEEDTAGIHFTPHVSASPVTVVAGQTTTVTVTYTAPLPIIDRVSPKVGRAGDLVRIEGHQIAGAPLTVTFGGVPATVVSVTSYDLTVTAPPHDPALVDVVVTGYTGTSTVMTHARFGYYALDAFPLPTPSAGPAGITAGADGKVWFTERSAGKIGVITTAGVVTEYPLASSNAQPTSIVADQSGNLWFTEYGNNAIGMITPAGVITEHALPDTTNRWPYDIALGPDGALWFVESGNGFIGRMATDGTFSEVPIPTAGAGAHQIALGPDGDLWFTEYGNGSVAKLTTAGVITEYNVVAWGSPSAITRGGDGNIWFTMDTAPAGLGRITPAGTVTTFQTSPWFPAMAAGGMTVAADGAVWYPSADSISATLVRVDGAGGQVGYVLSNQGTSSLTHITAGPDGRIWACDPRANAIQALAY